MSKFNKRPEFEAEYNRISLAILKLEQERTKLLASYRDSLGLTAEERVLVVKELWPNKEEILRRTGLSITTIKATASSLGLTAHPKKLARETVRNKLYVQRLGGVVDPD
ncbi:MAG: hypothetical protein AAB794_01615 [Patescibacteria group bacterium]